MSSIFNALKKLEREKSGRFPESMDLDLDILRSTDSSRSYSPLALVLLRKSGKIGYCFSTTEPRLKSCWDSQIDKTESADNNLNKSDQIINA